MCPINFRRMMVRVMKRWKFKAFGWNSRLQDWKLNQAPFTDYPLPPTQTLAIPSVSNMTKLYWTAIWDCWRCKFASLLLVSTVLRSWLFQYYSLKEKISDQIILDPARKRHHCSVMNHNLWFSPASLFRYDSLNNKKSQIKLILIRPDNSIILIPKPKTIQIK